MFSSICRNTRPTGPTVVVMLAVVLLAPMASAMGAAKETPLPRGKKATIKWLDEKGGSREAAGIDIVYGYDIRTFLKVPKDGRNYKDEVREEKGISLAGEFTPFIQIEKVELAWKTDAESDVTHLGITVTLWNGKVRSGSGNTLPGASHPSSPYIAFTFDGQRQRLDINPLASAAERAGKPQLVSITFLR